MSLRVTIIGHDSHLRSRCETALRGMPTELVADNAECDVALIIDGTDTFEVAADIATILIADCQPAADALAFDAHLPLDFTDRELRLVCQLAARVTAERRLLAESRNSERSLREQVETDPLTGLANRRSWDAVLKRSVEQSLSTKTPLVLAFLDLDHFKRINAHWGFSVGDRVLAEVAHALAASLRNHDFVARIGGDEFGLLLPGLPSDRAARVVERIRLAVSGANQEPLVTASAGLAVATGEEPRDAEALARELFELADQCLRKAKALQGNRTVG